MDDYCSGEVITLANELAAVLGRARSMYFLFVTPTGACSSANFQLC